MTKETALVLIITALIYFCITDVYADTVTIVQPDGNIQICKVTPSGVIVCL